MLTRLIDEYISEKRGESQLNDKFRVSDAGRCHLMRFWKRQGKPASDMPDSRTQRVFEVGHVFHEWIQNILTEKGVIVEKEFEVEDIHRRGHVDAVIASDEGLILYDFKTVHSRKFHHNRREGIQDLHYQYQAFTYSTMLPFGVADVRIAYISKDDLCISEVSVSPDVAGAVRKDWYSLIDAWEAQTEPPPNPMAWECQYCIYRSSCQYSSQGGMHYERRNNAE